MDILYLTLILLVAVLASNWIAKALPIAIPMPIIQIVLGAGIAHWTTFEVALQPELFFALFIPALLYLDGWRIPKDDLARDAKTVIGMAVGLVFVTVAGLGYLIHLMIPSMPLPVAFALAAILSPTDPVAVSGITAKLPMPKRLLHILEGEALLNDASGLSAFRIAVAAMVTGHFAIQHAVSDFISMSMGGALAGVIVAYLMLRAQSFMANQFGEDPGPKVLVSILIPFAAYFGAEVFHFSGILAAATAGIYMAYAEMNGPSHSQTRMQRNSVWDMLAFTANGTIFVLLGEQFPKIVANASAVMRDAETAEPWMLVAYVALITVALLAARMIWVGLNFWIMNKGAKGKDGAASVFSMRPTLIATFAGVRGSITLAGIMTLPLSLADGSPFPGRDLAIFLAAGVIVSTMLLASITLPFLLRGMAKSEMPVDEHDDEVTQAKVAATREAMAAIERGILDLAKAGQDVDMLHQAANRAMHHYSERLDNVSDEVVDLDTQRKTSAAENALLLIGLNAERDTLFRLGRERKISDAAVRKLVRPIDLSEAKLSAS